MTFVVDRQDMHALVFASYCYGATLAFGDYEMGDSWMLRFYTILAFQLPAFAGRFTRLSLDRGGDDICGRVAVFISVLKNISS